MDRHQRRNVAFAAQRARAQKFHHRADAHFRVLADVDKHLKKAKLVRVPSAADGNCLFHSIAAFFGHQRVTHTHVRRMIVEYIYKNPDKFKLDIEVGMEFPSVNHYCRAMIRPGVWGDAICISAFCMMQNVNIVVFTQNGPTEIHPGDRPKLAIARVGSHYDATTSEKNMLRSQQMLQRARERMILRRRQMEMSRMRSQKAMISPHRNLVKHDQRNISRHFSRRV